jgi:hypothetical protein
LQIRFLFAFVILKESFVHRFVIPKETPDTKDSFGMTRLCGMDRVATTPTWARFIKNEGLQGCTLANLYKGVDISPTALLKQPLCRMTQHICLRRGRDKLLFNDGL